MTTSSIKLVELVKTHYTHHITNKIRVPLCIQGPSGVGKSAQIKQAAKELKVEFFDIRLSQFDPVDIKGLPFPDVTAGFTRWLANQVFHLPEDTQAIMLLDEITSIDPSMQSAVYEILLDHKAGGMPLPHNLMIICAGNRQEDKGTYYPLAAPIYNRCITINYTLSTEEFIGWAMKNNVHHSVTSFLDKNSGYTHNFNGEEGAFATPRSWTTVSQIIDAYGIDSVLLSDLVFGAVGSAAGFAYLAYVKEVVKLPEVEDVLKGKAKYPEGVMHYSMSHKFASWVKNKKQLTEVCKFLLVESTNEKSHMAAESQLALFLAMFNRATTRNQSGEVVHDKELNLIQIPEFIKCMGVPTIRDVITKKYGKNLLK